MTGRYAAITISCSIYFKIITAAVLNIKYKGNWKSIYRGIKEEYLLHIDHIICDEKYDKKFGLAVNEEYRKI